MQLLTGFEVEPVDHPDDGVRRARTQRFRQGPERFFAMRRLDQNEAARIETKAVEAVAKKPAVLASAVGRHDEDERGRAGDVRQQRDDEAEGGGYSVLRLGHDLMQGAAGQTALRQAGIESGQAERQRLARTFPSGQQAA